MKPNRCECGHWVEDHHEYHMASLNRCSGDSNYMYVCPCKEFIEEREDEDGKRIDGK